MASAEEDSADAEASEVALADHLAEEVLGDGVASRVADPVDRADSADGGASRVVVPPEADSAVGADSKAARLAEVDLVDEAASRVVVEGGDSGVRMVGMVEGVDSKVVVVPQEGLVVEEDSKVVVVALGESSSPSISRSPARTCFGKSTATVDEVHKDT